MFTSNFMYIHKTVQNVVGVPGIWKSYSKPAYIMFCKLNKRIASM